MLPDREMLLCRYHYDPLDRLIDCMPYTQATTRRFYLKDRLATEIQGAVQHSIMQHDDQLLAQQQRQNGTVESHLFATDQQRSVLNLLDAARPRPLAYSPYGHRPAENGLLSLLGFNGERPDPVTGCYLLGNGYRAFNPVLMRFNSPDSWSPFGDGGLNAYAYCKGEPVNHEDQSGHAPTLLRPIIPILSSLNPFSSSRSTQGQILSTPVAGVRSGEGVFNSPTNSMPPAYSKTDPQPALNNANQAIISAESAQYSGSKLNHLIHHKKKLSKLINENEKYVNRVYKWLFDEHQASHINQQYLLLDAKKTVSTTLERRIQKVISSTEKLNKRIREQTDTLQPT